MTTMPRNTQDTQQQFKDVMQECRDLFGKKLIDYGASWRIMRTSSLTDQLFIKAKRIRSLEVKGEAWVDEGIRPEFIAIINYGIVGLIQLARGFADEVDMQPDEALKLYDSYAQQALSLMIRKNHDYDEAWRGMRVSSYTDFIRRHRFQLHGHNQLCRVRSHQAEGSGGFGRRRQAVRRVRKTGNGICAKAAQVTDRR